MSEIKNRLKHSIINSTNKVDVVFPTIDFDELEQNAHRENAYKKVVKVKKSGLWANVWRILTFGRGGYEEKRVLDEEGKIKSFIDSLTLEFMTSLRSFVNKLSIYISDFGSDVQKDIKEKTSQQLKKNEELLAEEQSNKKIERNIDIINNGIVTINGIIEQLKNFRND